MRGRRWVLPGVLALLAVTGCKDADRDQLRKVGSQTGSNLQDLAGGPRGKTAGILQGVRGTLSLRNSDDRVAARLRFDKGMQGADVTVKLLSPGVVELTGKVRSAEQKQLAVELANGTVGVEKVSDKLEVQN